VRGPSSSRRSRAADLDSPDRSATGPPELNRPDQKEVVNEQAAAAAAAAAAAPAAASTGSRPTFNWELMMRDSAILGKNPYSSALNTQRRILGAVFGCTNPSYQWNTTDEKMTKYIARSLGFETSSWEIEMTRDKLTGANETGAFPRMEALMWLGMSDVLTRNASWITPTCKLIGKEVPVQFRLVENLMFWCNELWILLPFDDEANEKEWSQEELCGVLMALAHISLYAKKLCDDYEPGEVSDNLVNDIEEMGEDYFEKLQKWAEAKEKKDIMTERTRSVLYGEPRADDDTFTAPEEEMTLFAFCTILQLRQQQDLEETEEAENAVQQFIMAL